MEKAAGKPKFHRGEHPLGRLANEIIYKEQI